jgi:hypothetical protein
MPSPTVVPFPATTPEPALAPTCFEKIWGKKVKAHGYAAIPTIMIRAQHRLGVNSTQFCILLQLLEYFRSPDRAPVPTKQQLADRIGIKPSSIKPNMTALEQAGLIQRAQHKTSAGDWGANTYHLDGLIQRIKELEPDFAEEKKKKEQARKRAETPKGNRGIETR